MTDTPMTPDRDPSRREELMFMLLHGGARSEAIAQRVVDLALAEAGAEKKTEVDRLRKALSDATDQVAELEDGLGQASAENAALRERLRKAPLRGRALLDAKAGEEATATHWKRLGIDPAAGEAVAAELEAAGSRLTAVELLVEEARDKCNHSIDTDLLLDALGLSADAPPGARLTGLPLGLTGRSRHDARVAIEAARKAARKDTR